MSFRSRMVFVISAVLLGLLAATAGSARAGGGADGAVYTLSNQAGGNAVLAFARADDGALTPDGSFPTGGLGTGAELGSQGAFVLTQKWLFGVDAGSNAITAFKVEHDGLSRVSHVASGGVMPISLTVDHDLVYVLNAGDATHAASITGFTFKHGTLEQLAGSTQPLSSAAPGPAQVEFTPDGRVLVVTEKNTNLIDTYVVGKDGLATGPQAHPSAGTTPFGFNFDNHGNLIVSDAFGGASGASALSSYEVGRDGTVRVAVEDSGDGFSPEVGPACSSASGAATAPAPAAGPGSDSRSRGGSSRQRSLELVDAIR